MSNFKKVGIFGGAFDPVHIGHLFIARAALEELGLEKIIFIPSGNPPHKTKFRGVSDQDRVRMLHLATDDEPRFEIDLREIGEKSYTYSYLTMRDLHREHPEILFYFLIGEDSLRDLPEWKCPGELVRCCVIAAAGRKGISGLSIETLLKERQEQLGGEFVSVNCPYIDISSTEIRQRIAAGHSVKYYVPDAVERYISRNNLYRENVDAQTNTLQTSRVKNDADLIM